MANLNFKYGTGDITTSEAGTVYVKKTGSKKAQMFIDNPVDENERLQIGGEIYIGDPEDAAAANYQVVINPDGDPAGVATSAANGIMSKEHVQRLITLEEALGGLKFVVSGDPPSSTNPPKDTITIVVPGYTGG